MTVQNVITDLNKYLDGGCESFHSLLKNSQTERFADKELNDCRFKSNPHHVVQPFKLNSVARGNHQLQAVATSDAKLPHGPRAVDTDE